MTKAETGRPGQWVPIKSSSPTLQIPQRNILIRTDLENAVNTTALESSM